jgi:hypothetical protein
MPHAVDPAKRSLERTKTELAMFNFRPGARAGTLQIHCKEMEKVPTKNPVWYIVNTFRIFQANLIAVFPAGNVQYIHSVPSHVTVMS